MIHRIGTLPPGPNATKIINIIKRISYNSTFTYPLVIAKGHDSIIEDVDGNAFLDFTSNIGACPLGYSHPEIIEILKEYQKMVFTRLQDKIFIVKNMLK